MLSWGDDTISSDNFLYLSFCPRLLHSSSMVPVLINLNHRTACAGDGIKTTDGRIANDRQCVQFLCRTGNCRLAPAFNRSWHGPLPVQRQLHAFASPGLSRRRRSQRVPLPAGEPSSCRSGMSRVLRSKRLRYSTWYEQ